MATISKVIYTSEDTVICQGDIFKNVKYCFIDSEDENGVDFIEYIFPYAIIISQACDVVAMGELLVSCQGKATKFMPSILMCPIYDEQTAKSTEHLINVFEMENIDMQRDNLFFSDDIKVARNDWHYRFHKLTLQQSEKVVLDNSLIDFKHYFTIPAKYLMNQRKNRLCTMESLFTEQITLKFCTYLSRVAIP